MADPLSVTAGVIAVAGLAYTSSKIGAFCEQKMIHRVKQTHEEYIKKRPGRDAQVLVSRARGDKVAFGL